MLLMWRKVEFTFEEDVGTKVAIDYKVVAKTGVFNDQY